MRHPSEWAMATREQRRPPGDANGPRRLGRAVDLRGHFPPVAVLAGVAPVVAGLGLGLIREKEPVR
jgi:hypothetical protein